MAQQKWTRLEEGFMFLGFTLTYTTVCLEYEILFVQFITVAKKIYHKKVL